MRVEGELSSYGTARCDDTEATEGSRNPLSLKEVAADKKCEFLSDP